VTSPKRLLILGKQGAGKGTQAGRLAAELNVPHISTGDMFRAAIREGTTFGKKAKGYMDRGELVPDDVVIGLVAERLAQDDAVTRGFLLDGFPRTRSQAEELERVLEPESLDAAIDLEIDTAVVLKRLSGRRVCVECGTPYHVDRPPQVNWTCDLDGAAVVQRDDDTEAAISRRLELYERETGPLIDFYAERGVLVPVDGEGTVDEVFDRMMAALRERPPFANNGVRRVVESGT
jgi:adenylate kinase